MRSGPDIPEIVHSAKRILPFGQAIDNRGDILNSKGVCEKPDGDGITVAIRIDRGELWGRKFKLRKGDGDAPLRRG